LKRTFKFVRRPSWTPLNVWDEKLPEFDQEAIGAKYKGINKEPMNEAEQKKTGDVSPGISIRVENYGIDRKENCSQL
jgi:hypothetical protein